MIYSVIPSTWARLKIVCPLEWMATGPLPTVLMTCPFQWQSTPYLTNSLLIPVGMYVYCITCPLILTISLATILNFHTDSFCPLDTALALTSDNRLLNFPPSIPLGTPWWHLSKTLVMPSLSSYIRSLLIEKDGRVHLNILILIQCVFMCLSYGDLFNFW